jgi:N4-gp56 family major capsid protein
MAFTQRSNIAASGTVLQTWLKKKILPTFEPELRFYDMGEKATWDKGYNTLSWIKPVAFNIATAPTILALTEGVTPGEQSFQMKVISLTANQYGMHCVITDLLSDVEPVNIYAEAAKAIGNQMARVVDEVIQGVVSLGAQAYYAGSAANRAALVAGDTLKAVDLAKAHARLRTNGASYYKGGDYVAVMSPVVMYDLQQQAGVGTFIDINKYAKPDEIMSGEVGKLFGVRIVTSSNIKTFVGTAALTVYPTYVMGSGAYGVADLQSMQMFHSPRVASDSDPLAQREKVGAKVAFNAIILQEQCLARIESASSLPFTWNPNTP